MKKINYEKTVEKIRENLRNYLVKNDLKSLVIGVSGGADSGLISALCYPVCKELGVELIGRLIIIESNKPDEIERARNIGQYFCTNFTEVNLTTEFHTMKNMVNLESLSSGFNGRIIGGDPETERETKIRLGNIKARMRMIYLYDLAQKNKGLVLSTDNYTEFLVGFWTLHGDEGDYGMIQELWKTEVYGMIEWFSKNEISGEASDSLASMLDAVATDGLGITNSDLDQLLPDWKERHTTTREGYKEVDNILEDYLSESNNPLDEYESVNISSIISSINKIIKETHPVISRHLRTQFKRDNPINLKRKDIIE